MFIWIIYIKTGHMKKSYIRIEGRIILKIKVLEYFITLAESQSINEAAGKLYIAPASQKLCSCLRRRSALSCFKEKKREYSLLKPEREFFRRQSRW